MIPGIMEFCPSMKIPEDRGLGEIDKKSENFSDVAFDLKMQGQVQGEGQPKVGFQPKKSKTLLF